MRWPNKIVAVLALCACQATPPPNPAPPGNPAYPNQFYFPTGLAHVDATLADGGQLDGTLFVANGNFDRRFDRGSIVALDLKTMGLPAFGAPLPATGPVLLPTLHVQANQVAQIASFAGEMGMLKTPTGVRLFVPTRSELNRVYAVDSPNPASPDVARTLKCVVPNFSDAGQTIVDPNGLPDDCSATGQSLTSLEKTDTGIPRAPSPIGIGVSAKTNDVWITSLQQADSPRGSTLNPVGYLVRLDGLDPLVTESSFVSVGPGATSSVAVGDRYAYATGRIYLAATPSFLVRMVDSVDAGEGVPNVVFSPGLEQTYTVFEGRGIALSRDERRAYIASRSPDSLIVASISGQMGPLPGIAVEHSVPLPEGPDLVLAIPRAGRTDLIAIACSTAGVVALYDDDVGDLVAQVSGVGLQPYAMAVDTKPAQGTRKTDGARLFVSNFTDGRIAVIDIPDLTHPKTSQIVAFMGQSQLCLTRSARDNSLPSCDGGAP